MLSDTVIYSNGHTNLTVDAGRSENYPDLYPGSILIETNPDPVVGDYAIRVRVFLYRHQMEALRDALIAEIGMPEQKEVAA